MIRKTKKRVIITLFCIFSFFTCRQSEAQQLSLTVQKEYPSSINLNLHAGYSFDNKEYKLYDINLKAPLPWGYVCAGKAALSWGPGESGNLILSPNTGLDLLKIGGSMKLWGIPFAWENFWAKIEDRGGLERGLFGHRINIIYRNWELGLAETVVLSGDFSPWFYNPVPVIPYYLIQHLLLKADSRSATTNYASNIMLQVDLVWDDKKGVKLYSAFLVDDMPGIPYSSKVPWRVGLLTGGDFLFKGFRIKSEYVLISRYTYTYLVERGDYISYGELLGHPLGPDANLWWVEFLPGKRVNDLYYGLKFIRKRHGEGRLGDRYKIGENPEGLQILTGVVEDTSYVGVITGYNKDFSKYNLNIRMDLGYTWIVNPSNQEGFRKGCSWEISAAVKF